MVPPTGDGKDEGHADTSAAEAALKARLSRKRTKTGCLTCRKRRIKCGEERPICQNCIKSRRHCEGYVQRVIFKPPTFEYRPAPNGGAHITFQAGLGQGEQAYYRTQSQYGVHPDIFPALQPRAAPVASTLPDRQFQPFSSAPSVQHPLPMSNSGFHRQLQASFSHQSAPPRVDPAAIHDIYGARSQPHQPPIPIETDPLLPGETRGSLERFNILSRTKANNVPRSNSSASSDHSRHVSLPTDPAMTFEDYQQYAQVEPGSGPTQMLHDAAVETQDDDYYDVESDEIEGITTDFDPNSLKIAALSLADMANKFIPPQIMHLRSLDTFIHHGMMGAYRAEFVANPLRNPATARVFFHFISATGPTLSPFERGFASGTAIFAKESIPLSQRGIWTYTMPMAALRNQGLLHAMLAISSLHIAKLQGGSLTPSMQHYAWSLKRIHHAVADRRRRLRLPTIAASLLLGFYEIMTADHSKWSTHLAGARQLIMECDFDGMMRQFRQLKVDRLHFPQPTTCMLDEIEEIDENMISRFFGHQVSYGDQGYVEGSPPRQARLDLSKLEILKDLFWWYCKQDAYQSIVSGNPLLMDYTRWAVCPPRASMGRPDAVYGTFDHLILLLGRVASFAAKDRKRKLHEMEENGGHWRPHPASKMARAQPQGRPSPNPGPTFYGMAPMSTEKAQMPSQYRSLDGRPSPARDQEIYDIETALAEYEAIQLALQEFEACIIRAFPPLDLMDRPPVASAFGNALLFPSYDIACLWSSYSMTKIIALRSHPYLHPAAHVAAGMAAAETAHYANNIGRIAAGISPGPPDVPISPTLSSALVESCMPSFFAAIQYQQADQRRETVVRIFNIARRTGWATADLIASGCETAWVKAAETGRGQPYQRTVRDQLVNSTDSRITGSHEMLDMSAQPDETDQIDKRFVRQKASARLHWAIGIMGNEDEI